ncbi:hypothetical protein TURU_037751 [Turdus rufiventris]|nr:hypothetical protein TURU_037751 [Turdus rufiventris]
MGSRDPPAAQGGAHRGAEIHLQPKGACDPLGSPCCKRLLAGLVAPQRKELMLQLTCWQDLCSSVVPMLEQPVPEGAAAFGGSLAEPFVQNCSRGEDSARALHRGLSPTGQITLEQGKTVGNPPHEEKKQQR